MTHVDMESAGAYWKPVYNLLEGLDMTLLVVNARHIKAVPGRKTEIRDAEWIAELLQHSPLRGSFVPDRPHRELRELVRFRRTLVRQREAMVSLIQKVLEGANIKLGVMVSDVMGGLRADDAGAIIRGQEYPAQMANLARGKLLDKLSGLEDALRGLVGPHQRFMLRSLLRQVNLLDAEILQLDAETEERLHPSEDKLERLDTISGAGRRTAEELVAAISTDMSRFPSEKRVASWARMCPGNNESAGKRKSGCTGKGGPWVRDTLVKAAHGAGRSKNNCLSSQYRRLAARRGKKIAPLAVGHNILGIAYHVLKHATIYQDFGPDYYDERTRHRTVRRAVQRIESLGYRVTLEEAA